MRCVPITPTFMRVLCSMYALQRRRCTIRALHTQMSRGARLRDIVVVIVLEVW
jgi:hypothetical protein